MWTRQSALELVLGVLGFGIGAEALGHAAAWVDESQPGSTSAPAASPAPSDASDPAPPVAGVDDTPNTDCTASYTLSVTLDPSEHLLHGSGTIRWINASREPANELYFHLYLNAFKNSETLFERSPFDRGRSGRGTKHWGYIDVNKLVAREFGAQNLWANADKHSPGDEQDETDIRVPLPGSVAPNAGVTLDVEWEAKLPELSERTGYAGDFFMVGQWFPKLAKRERDGRWAHFAFHPQSEFYADYGDYDVTIDVPSNLVVGASGELVAEQREADRKHLEYRARTVHDFAWTAWASFKERSEVIDGIQTRLLYPPDHETVADRELAALRFALPRFDAAYGRYPYPTLTVVHPPANAADAGGMEYPTLITTGSNLLHNLFVREVETVTVHELGHQWFYGLLGSNEHASPFLDEGINSYAESVTMKGLFGTASGGQIWDLRISADAYRRAIAASDEHDDAVAAAADEFASFSDLGALVYARTATILETLARVYGEDRLNDALGRYARKYRFRHPTAEDFVEEVAAVLDADTKANLKTLLLERGWVDYEVGRVDSVAARAPNGIFDGPEGRITRDRAALDSDSIWLGQFLIYRHGTASFPVDVDLIAADGSTTRRHWDGRGNWVKLSYEGSSKLVAAVVDPDLKISIDDNLLNNSLRTRSAGTPRSLERALYVAQLFLALVGP